MKMVPYTLFCYAHLNQPRGWGRIPAMTMLVPNLTWTLVWTALMLRLLDAASHTPVCQDSSVLTHLPCLVPHQKATALILFLWNACSRSAHNIWSMKTMPNRHKDGSQYLGWSPGRKAFPTQLVWQVLATDSAQGPDLVHLDNDNP